MKLLCVDDEPIVLESLRMLLLEQPDVDEAVSFLSSEAALFWLKDHRPDAAFLDINMGGTNGLVLAKQLREFYPNCAVVFVTGYSEYALDAFSLHADGYLLKPVSSQDIRRELDLIQSRYAIMPPKQKDRIRVQCFGNFEVFYHDTPVRFERTKAKELFAYLVDRQGTSISMGELIGVLWEDTANTLSVRSNLRNLISVLRTTFSQLGMDDILIKNRNTLTLNCDAIDCDFYDFLKGMPYAVNLYRGEYMSQYSWAEFTTARLLHPN